MKARVFPRDKTCLVRSCLLSSSYFFLLKVGLSSISSELMFFLLEVYPVKEYNLNRVRLFNIEEEILSVSMTNVRLKNSLLQFILV